jgi:hypothetical protein
MKILMFIVSLLVLFIIKGYGQIDIDSVKLYQYHKSEAIMTPEGQIRDTVYLDLIKLSQSQTDSISLILSSSSPRIPTKGETESLSKNLLIYFNGKESCYHFDLNENLINLSDKTLIKITNEHFVNYLKNIFRNNGED